MKNKWKLKVYDCDGKCIHRDSIVATSEMEAERMARSKAESINAADWTIHK